MDEFIMRRIVEFFRRRIAVEPHGAMNYGFSWKFADNVAFLFGYEIYNDPNFANTFTIQTGIDF